MFRPVKLGIATLVRLLRSRQSLLLENLALRQQLAVLKRRNPRPSLGNFDRLFWGFAPVVGLEAVAHLGHPGNSPLAPSRVSPVLEVGFQSQGPIGRRPASQEVRDLISRMVADNPTWGAPRIHGELLMLGFEVSERTVSRWMKRAPRNPEPAKRWLAFLRNHREAIAAMDFFTVPTITFGVLYCLFVIGHDRRRILHFNVTKHPASRWIVQQLREAFPFDSAPRFLIFDRDSKYGAEFPAAARSLTITPLRTSERLGGLHHRYDRAA